MSITALTRGLLLNQEGAGGAGGGAVTFTAEQQAKVDQIVQERLAKAKAEAADAKKAHDALKAEFDGIKGKMDELSTAAATAREEAELKGKSDLEKLQHQYDKAQKLLKDQETAAAKKIADSEAAAKATESRLHDYVKRSAALSALSSGLADGAAEDAVQSFLSGAEVELDEKLGVKSIQFGGKTFDKPEEAAASFFTAKPHFAKAPAGGSGGPRTARGAGAPDPSKATPAELFRTGFSQAPAQGTGVELPNFNGAVVNV
jgi:hypothetical protein